MVKDTDQPMEVKELIQDPVITGQILPGILTKNADNGSGWPRESKAQQPSGSKKMEQGRGQNRANQVLQNQAGLKRYPLLIK